MKSNLHSCISHNYDTGSVNDFKTFFESCLKQSVEPIIHDMFLKNQRISLCSTTPALCVGPKQNLQNLATILILIHSIVSHVLQCFFSSFYAASICFLYLIKRFRWALLNQVNGSPHQSYVSRQSPSPVVLNRLILADPFWCCRSILADPFWCCVLHHNRPSLQGINLNKLLYCSITIRN